MARPPQQRTSPRRCRLCTGRRSLPSTYRAVAALAIAGLAPVATAHAARSCEEWSAEITTVEGVAEVLRGDSPTWIVLATGDRVCSGETIDVKAASRVTVTLPDENTLRLDEHTTLVVPEPPSGVGSLIELLRGAIHVISRDPRLLRFTTPYANAGLEGTEFDIRVDDQARVMEVVVLEGTVVVANASGEIDVTSNHVAIAQEGQPPTASPLPAPIELMRWASHYPSIIDYSLPAPDQEPLPAQQMDAQFFAERAAARLATGGIDAAQADIDAALGMAPRNVTALSLQALLALARADREGALAHVARALEAEPTAVIALLAQSLVAQRSGDLAAAERSIRAALAVAPDHAIALTRLAELAVAQGDARLAIDSATRARALAPTHSAPLVVLGFAHLGAFDTDAAYTAFAAAVTLEPDAPLPHLGLGEASLRRGDQLEGRRQLELAVALDPANALTRSYVAKIYDTENRGSLTASQLDLAKSFDPADHTPWLYSATQKLRSNRPVEAFHDLRAAADRHGDRPVFRSSLGLDEDIATRSAGLSRVYTELGFGRLGLLDAWEAIADDSTDFAGHRLLSDAYSTEPRHEIARVSELLVSQLLQPANVTPIKPQLAQPNLFISQRAGPSPTSFDELDSPVLMNGLKLRASAIRGGHGTSGEDVTLAGLHDQLSYSVGYYDFATDGFRDNNDLDQSILSGFLQVRPSPATNLQAELRSVRTEHGDLALLFNPEIYSPLVRVDEDADSVRLGAKQQLARNDVLLGSLIVQDANTLLTNGEALSVRVNQQGYSADVQHIHTARATQIQSGIVYAQQDEETERRVTFPPGPPDVLNVAGESRQLSAYSYANFSPTAAVTVTVGASFDQLEDAALEDDAFSPKLGVIWRPTAHTTIRAASFKTLFGSLTTSTQNPQPRLEPVEVAGFTQLLFGGRADRSTVSGLAIEQELSPRVFVGWEASLRDTDRIVLDTAPGEPPLDMTLNERTQHAYLYWTPLDRLSFSARYEHGRFRSEPIELLGYSEMTTSRLPIEARYFAPGGLTIGARATYVEQEGIFRTSSESPFLPWILAPGHDRFAVLDAFIGYRLPNRRGMLSLNADNLLDEDFRFQDVDPTNPSIMPERLVSFRFTLAFD